MNTIKGISRYVLAGGLLASSLYAAELKNPRPKGPIQPEDWLRYENLFPGPISPDGTILVFSKTPPMGDRLAAHGEAIGETLRDVWLFSKNDKQPRCITDTLKNGAGYYSPLWSPDGKYLALLARRGSIARLEIWDRNEGTLRSLTGWFIPVSNVDHDLFQWLDARGILWLEKKTAIRELDARLSFDEQAILHGWLAMARGEVSASVRTSGGDPKFLPTTRVNVTDMNGNTKLLAEGTYQQAHLTSDRSRLALIEDIGEYQPDPVKPIPWFNQRHTPRFLTIVPTDGAGSPKLVPDSRGVEPHSLKWSPDGTKLLFARTDLGEAPSTSVLDVKTNRTERLFEALPGGLTYKPEQPPMALPPNYSALFWSNANDLLAYRSGDQPAHFTEYASARPAAHIAELDRPDGVRRTGWLVRGVSGWTELGGVCKSAAALYREAGARGFLCIAGGKLWRVELGKPEGQEVSSGVAGRIVSIRTDERHSLALSAEGDGVGSHLIVRVQTAGNTQEYVEFDTIAGTSHRIPLPDGAASLLSWNDTTKAVEFSKNDRGSSTLFGRLNEGGEAQVLAGANEWMRTVERPEQRLVTYRSLDGRDLKARLTLPTGYRPGTRYPLVTIVYPGTQYQSLDAGPAVPTTAADPLLLVNHGYAVLEPSMPTDHFDVAHEISDELLNGVMPAIDRVVELEIADPDRLAVMGHSFGGYAVNQIITLTSRFKAAVSFDGYADLISVFGTFGPLGVAGRFQEGPLDLFSVSETESGQAKMGGPPWRYPEKYIRHSPIFAVEKVTTPVLIVQGDWDYVPLEQGEEFFTALWRLKKPARFVRYWGEGHWRNSYANKINELHEVLNWLDHYLK
jgi:dipeptidyl aminopeptidase/acylaminoacyl peptidase